MPLFMANLGEEYLVKKIAGLEETKRHLENLGFICGAQVCVIAVMNKSLIVQIKDSRVAISRELAEKIMIWILYHNSFTKQYVESRHANA